MQKPPEQMTQKVPRVTGWAMLDRNGKIIVNSIRDSAQATRLAAGEGRVYPVKIIIDDDRLLQERRANGDSVAALAHERGVSKTAIYNRLEAASAKAT